MSLKGRKHRYDPVQGRGEENGSQLSKLQDAFSPAVLCMKFWKQQIQRPGCQFLWKLTPLSKGNFSITASHFIPGILLQTSQPSYYSSGTCCEDTTIGDETFLKLIWQMKTFAATDLNATALRILSLEPRILTMHVRAAMSCFPVTLMALNEETAEWRKTQGKIRNDFKRLGLRLDLQVNYDFQPAEVHVEGAEHVWSCRISICRTRVALTVRLCQCWGFHWCFSTATSVLLRGEGRSGPRLTWYLNGSFAEHSQRLAFHFCYLMLAFPHLRFWTCWEIKYYTAHPILVPAGWTPSWLPSMYLIIPK